MKIRHVAPIIAMLVLPIAVLGATGSEARHSSASRTDAALMTAIASPKRPLADRVRDPARHPLASLSFWGIRPGITLIDLQPEGGYWTEILAPYLAKTGGTYIAGVTDLDDPNENTGLKANRLQFEASHKNRIRYGTIRYAAFGEVSGPLAPPNSVDVVLSAREVHKWIQGKFFDKALKDIFSALKPGGFFAVEEHRADPITPPPGSYTGYVNTKTVIDAALRAGFVLDGSSEINANPKDIKDYPFGVWTLPPVRLSDGAGHTSLTDRERAQYDAIGESDRMTLRFRKPANP